MPDSEAVYQPTTVGYTYENGGDSHEVGGGPGIRNGFSRIMFRHKVSTRKWLEWVLLSVAICATVAGFTTLVVNLVATDGTTIANNSTQSDNKSNSSANDGTKVEDKVQDSSRGSLAVGASITLVGVLMGALWIWLRMFRHGGKSQRGGMGRASGQMLGGLNPSTDLLVGSTSQYGPVLTEVPSQMSGKEIINDNRSIPMSDQEEETHTLMEDATGNSTSHTNGQEANVNNQNTG